MTTVARVKALHGAISDTKQDTVLAAIIAGRSADAAGLLDRHVVSGTYTDVFSPRKGQHVFRVKGYPISSITSVTNDGIVVPLSSVTHDGLGFVRIGPAYGVGLPLNQSIDPYASTKLWGDLKYGPGALTIAYTGGMAATTAAFIAAFPDLAYAMDLQVLFDFRRKDNLSQKSVTVGEGTTSYEKMDWLPATLRALRRNQRKLPLA